jgi:hypothetical protein
MSNKKPHRDLFLDRGAGWGQDRYCHPSKDGSTRKRSALATSGVLLFRTGTFVVRSPKWSAGGNLEGLQVGNAAGSRKPAIVGLLVAIREPHDPQAERGIAQANDLSVSRRTVV